MSVALISGVPQEIEVQKDGGRLFTLVPIGISPYGTVISVECSSTPKTHNGFAFHEFSFDIVRYSKTEVFAIQNRLVARKVLPDGGVHLVMSVVLNSYETIIDTLKPDYIYRCSAFTGLQEPPLRKHKAISETIQLCGYELSEKGRDIHGRSFWLHERTGGRMASLFDPHRRGQGVAPLDPKKTAITSYVSDVVHGEMQLLNSEAAAKHGQRVKYALRAYTHHLLERDKDRQAAA